MHLNYDINSTWKSNFFNIWSCGIIRPSYYKERQTQQRRVWTHQTKPKILWEALHNPAMFTHLSLFFSLILELHIYAVISQAREAFTEVGLSLV